MQTIMVVNSKGGCGKTTLATNLTIYCAGRISTLLMDYDPQGSCKKSLSLLPEESPIFHGIAARKNPPASRAVGSSAPWQARSA